MQYFFSILDWAAWAPGVDTEEKWREWGRSPVKLDRKGVPLVDDLPMMFRRRLGRLGRVVMRTACDIPQNGAHMVFSSRYGESSQTVKLLQDLAKNEPLSPTKFSTSVHNGLAGLFSIHSKNTAPHTVIAAGKNSFLHALLETVALLIEKPGRSVLLVHYDEPLPEFYEPFVDHDVPMLSLAMHLVGRQDSDEKLDVTISCEDKLDDPCNMDGALSFIRFLTGQGDGWVWPMGPKTWKCQTHV
jgi:hypothetical protein